MLRIIWTFAERSSANGLQFKPYFIHDGSIPTEHDLEVVDGDVPNQIKEQNDVEKDSHDSRVVFFCRVFLGGFCTA